jgi:hypothetical protein
VRRGGSEISRSFKRTMEATRLWPRIIGAEPGRRSALDNRPPRGGPPRRYRQGGCSRLPCRRSRPAACRPSWLVHNLPSKQVVDRRAPCKPTSSRDESPSSSTLYRSESCVSGSTVVRAHPLWMMRNPSRRPGTGCRLEFPFDHFQVKTGDQKSKLVIKTGHYHHAASHTQPARRAGHRKSSWEKVADSGRA